MSSVLRSRGQARAFGSVSASRGERLRFPIERYPVRPRNAPLGRALPGGRHLEELDLDALDCVVGGLDEDGGGDFNDFGAQNSSGSGNNDFLGGSGGGESDLNDFGAQNSSGSGNSDFLGGSAGGESDFNDFGAQNASGSGN